MAEPVQTRVVSLVRREDRRTAMAARLRAAGVAWTWQDAVDARAEDPARLRAAFPRPARAWPPLPAEMACALSHRAAWDAFLASGASALCVLEDDVHVAPALGALLGDASRITPALGILKLDLNARRPGRALAAPDPLPSPLPGHALWRLWGRRLGGGGYVAHRDVIARLARALPAFAAPIDHHLFNPSHAPLFRDPGVRLLLPAPVAHDHAGSDLAPERARQKAEGPWTRIRLWREAEAAARLPLALRARLAGARPVALEADPALGW